MSEFKKKIFCASKFQQADFIQSNPKYPIEASQGSWNELFL